MNILAQLHECGVTLALSDSGDQLRVRGKDDALGPDLLASLRQNKQQLIDLLRSGAYARYAGDVKLFGVAASLLPCDLDDAERSAIDLTVAGGAANIQDIYPLTPAQEGILFHHMMDREGDTYLLPMSFAFAGQALLDSFLDALQVVIDRHDILRTGMVWEGLATPLQVVWRKAPLQVQRISFDPADGDIARQLADRFDPRHYRIDVRQAPLVHCFIAEDAPNKRWALQLLAHHMAIDHAALEILVREVHAVMQGHAAALAPAQPFRHFVAQARLGVSQQEHEAFFGTMLGDVDEPTAPFGLLNVRADGASILEHRREVDKAVAGRLRERSRAAGVGVASLVHLAWAQVLSKLSGRQDVVFGTVMFGRMYGKAGASRAPGMFINTLPVRVALAGQQVARGVQATHALLAQLLRHEHAPLALAQRCSGVQAPLPLFSALLNYRHSAPAQDQGGWDGVQLLGGEERTNYPLTLSVDDLGEGFALTAQVDASVSAERICAYMHTALEQLVEALETAPQKPLAEIGILPVDERALLLEQFNATAASYPKDAGLHTLFAQQAARTPDAVALVHGDTSLTYAELEARSNQLAHYLQAQGAQGQLVALCVERSAEMVVAMLATLKAGAAYVPLDPAYPRERLEYMLGDSQPALVLTHGAGRLALAGMTAVRMLDLQADATLWADAPRAALAFEHDPSRLAYVIYTSGSTGQPKGVMLTHGNAVNFVCWARDAFSAEQLAQTLFATSLNFDLAVYECFVPLSVGGTVHVVDNALALLRETADVTLINTVPSAMDALVAASAVPATAQTVNLAGEALKRSLVERIFATTAVAQVCNLYGPSETTTYSTWVSMSREEGFIRHIGRPVANTQIYILDSHGQPAPLGVAGELYIGGAGVARGYLNRPELTAERFVPDPFNGGTMYRTGDLGRWLEDGNIEYLGRNDFQVKIRGFRIELGEIEARLAACAGVRESAVVAREDVAGDKRLVAYVVGEVDTSELRAELSSQLAEYMVPSAFVQLDALPLTPNGKLDRKALPAPSDEAYGQRAYAAPQGEVEEQLAAIWRELLHVEQVGRNDNFFELGGHSLLAVTLVERMRRIGVATDVRTLFGSPTIAALANVAAIDNTVVVPPNGIPPGCTAITPEMVTLASVSQAEIDRIVAAVPGGAANVQDIYPLAPLQEGILFHHLMATQGDTYLLPTMLSFDSRARVEAFLDAMRVVIDRHDILRTAMAWEGLAEPVQVVWREAPLHVTEIELDANEGDIAGQLAERFDPRRYRIDIRKAPLLHCFVAADAPNDRWVLQVLAHHMAIDHTALEILVGEILAVVQGGGAALAPAQPFRDFVAQARLGVSQQEHEAFFGTMLGDVDEPTAPFGLLDVQGDGTTILEHRREVDQQLAARLRQRTKSLGVSAASVMHLAWAQVLAKLSGRQDVVFGTVLFGRMQGGSGADRALGMFINTLPVRISLNGKQVTEDVRATHALLAQLLRHEHAPLALAQRCSGVQAPLPLFSALLNYRHSAPAQDQGGWDGVQLLGGEERTNYPLTLSVDDLGEGFALTAQVDASVSAERICAYMHTALEQLVGALETAPQKPLAEIGILPIDERTLLLEQFNATAAPYPKDAGLHTLFTQQAKRTPEAIALVHGDTSLTYAELDARSNQLAHYLQAQGAADRLVALCVERSAEMVVAMLATLKAGAAYVPLDPAYPRERLAYMLADSQPALVLTHGAGRQALADMTTGRMVDLQADAALWTDAPRAALDIEDDQSRLAYVIYTSGSTGQPKGVMLTHGNAVNFVCWARDAFSADQLARTLFATSLNFDLAVYECFVPLSVGGTVHVVDNALALLRETADVTLINTVPSAMDALVSGGAVPATAQAVNLAGEALKRSLVERIFATTGVAQVCNLYGPSETTTYSTWVSMSREQGFIRHIGRPVANTQVYILDSHGQPAPLGVAGELYIGGAGVARGYLNRPELTAERFVADPFNGGTMYRTGDLGHWLEDGNIEYLGRNDFQVKIRGFRIELGEIEARLAACAGVRESAVVAREDVAGDKRLVAYVVGDVDTNELRAELSSQLAEYMVPSAFVQLDALPLTPNGKLDRKALPAPSDEAYGQRAYAAPQGKVEEQLAAIWRELLHVEQVGRNDNFFELGGHSLLAVTLVERMRRIGVATDVRTLFGSPTIAALAATTGGDAEVIVPPNGILPGCTAITPEMVTLATLSAAEIDRIVAAVPGGAANVQDIYPLAPLQEGILFHHLMATQGDTYLVPTMLSFDSRARVDAFLDAMQVVIDRHDILRTAMAWEGLAEPVQVVWREAPLHVTEIELDANDGDIAGQLAERFDPRRYRIDVRKAPLLHCFVAADAPNDRWVLQVLAHHMAIDHTALEILVGEILAVVQGAGAALAPAQPFRDFVAQARLGVSQQEHEAFFGTMLGDVDEPTAPFGLLDVQGDGTTILEHRREVDQQLAARLRQRTKSLGVSAASVMHLAWAQVLAKLSGRQDVVFGTVLFGRMQGGADRALGMFINTLPVRISLGGQEVNAGLRATHAVLAQLLRHEHAPLALAQRCSGVQAPLPLFSALLNYRHSAPAQQEANWDGVQLLGGEERTNYPLTLSVDDLGEGFALTAQVDASVSAERICAYMHTALEQLVGALETAPQKPLAEIGILPIDERALLLEQFNATAAPYPKDAGLHTLFVQQAVRTPEAVALVHGDTSLTYAELDARSNQLAHYLQAQGAADQLVALCVERSVEMVVAMLATLKAGAAYVPLDPAYPRERLEYMLADSQPALVLTHGAGRQALTDMTAVRMLDLQADAALWADAPRAALAIEHDPSRLAYVIYTSGSTGQPKGVMVDHGNLANLVSWHCSQFSVASGVRSSSVAGLAFDACAWEVWPSLCAGGTLLLPPADADNPQDLLAWWEEQALDVSFLVTPLAEHVLHGGGANGRLRTLLTGGDRLRRLPTAWPSFALVNNYGPTETTVVATSGTLTADDRVVHIGRPIANTRIYILDVQGQPVPLGVAGELYIGGAGVARGYLNRPELTSERFVADPFNGGTMYRTGDLGRWLEDGNIEYLGRNDFQVKIRGFRIELGEIEARLAACAGVRESAVVAREDVAGDKRLVAYVVGEVDTSELRAELSSQLAEYMVPSAFVQLDALPLTPNGKLDRKALPAPSDEAYGQRAYAAPQGEVEEQLAAIWRELLHVEQVGRNDNFFELGGHSLLAVTLVERMRRVGVATDVRTLFGSPTIAALAATTAGDAEVIVPPNGIPPGCTAIAPEMVTLVSVSQAEIDRIVAAVPGGAANVQDIYPLAPLQEGILFHHLMATQGDTYLLPTMLSFDSRARVDAFLDAMQVVIDRHDILRTAMAWEGLAEPVQVVWREAPLHVTEIELDANEGDIAGQLAERFDPRRYRIDVRKAPLLHCFVAADAPNDRWVLQVLAHHMAIDHTALEILVGEILAVVQGAGAALAAAQPFRDFVAQARLGVSQQEHEAFFGTMLGDVDEPTAPFGLLDVQGDGTTILEYRREVDQQLAARLRHRTKSLGVSAASVMHLAWAQVLAKLSGRQDVVFGTVLFGRMQGGADRALGMFINTLPVRIALAGQQVAQGVQATHALLAQLLRHEHAPLALAQRCSGVQAPLPLFSALLNYRHSAPAQQEANWDGVQLLGGEERTNYPLTLSVDDLGEGFALTAQVDASVSAERICAYMHTALEQLADALETAPQKPLAEIGILPIDERALLLEQFNATAAPYPKDAGLHTVFTQQAERTPEAIALVHGDTSLSYAELDARSNQLAHYLQAQGAAGQLVALCVERSAEMVIAMLATLKAGAAYVPLDPAYPGERLEYMLGDSQPALVLTHGAGRLALADMTAVRMLDLQADAALWADAPRAALAIEHDPSRLAYVIYTSGSTGQPKGVMLTHDNAVNFVCWARDAFSADQLARTLFATSLNFDLAVYECFVPLSVGGTVHVVDNALALLRETADVTLINTVPSAMDALVSAGAVPATAQTVNLAGEALKRSLVERIFATTAVAQVCNLYGPSETTTYSTWVSMSREEGFIRHIGRPVANTQIYILDSHGQPAPLGVAGELYIGGAGVARGYLNRPELTAERFVPDPFNGGTMYRTGDLGRWLEDGNIEYLGRNDFQVKIRGFRIELGEIEARLAACAGVRESAVVAREDVAGDKRLVGYVVGDVDTSELRAELSSQLAEYMVPSAFVQLDALPLTPNGKLDRKALPAPSDEAYGQRAYQAPQGEIEEQLAAIWRELLHVEQVGRNDNFFELGGHSLLAVTLVERMRRIGVATDVRTLFGSPTIAALANVAAIDNTVVVPPNGIPPGCAAITPEMVTLVQLDAGAIDRIVAAVPGGAANVQDIYPLAPLQEGILFHHLMATQGDTYLLPTMLSFDSRARVDAFLDAMQVVIDRHDILRTAMAWEGLAEPVQVVWREAPLHVTEIELDANAGDIAGQLAERFDPRRYRIDVRKAPLLHCFVAADAPNDRWVLQVLAHHMAIDHTALEILVGEILAVVQGGGAALAPAQPFRDFVAQARLGVSQQEHEAFFGTMLGDVDEPTAPFGLLDVQGDGTTILECRREVDQQLAARLRQRTKSLGVSAASVMHLAWAQVLAKLSGRQDVVFGTVLFGRMQGGSGADRALGMFINTLPVRISLNEKQVTEGVRATHALLAQLLRHEHAPLALAQRCSGVQAPLPLFSALLNYRHSAPAQQEANWDGVQLLGGEERTNYPLTLSVDDLGEGFALTAQVDASVSAERICAYMHTALEQLVEALETAPQKPLAEIGILPVDERALLLERFNATTTPYPRDVGLHTLFAQQAGRTPEAIALVHGDTALTYAQLDARANGLAACLQSAGAGPDQRVAIALPRCADFVVAVLAVLKTGAAYVPLDTGMPVTRQHWILADCAATQVVAAAGFAVPEGVALVDVDAAPAAATATVGVAVAGDASAYIMYTSGSTGVPKGVDVPHRAVARLVIDNGYADFSAADRVAFAANPAFDASTLELWAPLLNGGTLVAIDQDVLLDPARFVTALQVQQVSVLWLTVGLFNQYATALAPALGGLRYLIVGGDALDPAVMRGVLRTNPPANLLNGYGPTETTTFATTYRIAAVADDASSIPLGRPIGNTRVYILDAHGQPVPLGVAGELYIGGDGVARGYLNRPELTAERFVPDPFNGGTMYRTGDLGRWLEDGNIEYLGRNDFQVKIRGFRIELGEIEARLAACDGVRETVVLAREEEPGAKRLVAYVVADEGLSLDTLRATLSSELADYMVPAAFVRLDALPLTPNGKLDRRALPAPDSTAYATAGYEAPFGESEEQLAAMWQDLLKIERVGRYDNFFELGGHSLLAVQLMSRVKQEFDVDIPLDKLFASPTIATLDECIVEAQLLQFDLAELQTIASADRLGTQNNTDTEEEYNQ